MRTRCSRSLAPKGTINRCRPSWRLRLRNDCESICQEKLVGGNYFPPAWPRPSIHLISLTIMVSRDKLHGSNTAQSKTCCLQMLVRGGLLGLYGFGLEGFSSVSLESYSSLLGGLPTTIPLASGLDLFGTTAYTDSALSPAPSCKLVGWDHS